MKEKTMSFVMPCYNDADTIEKAILSIKDQDLPDIEMIVVNDGSTDDSKITLDALKERGLIDHLIHFEKNQGACKARNEGAKIATGKYLSFLPADAILYPGMARIWYNALEENPTYDFVYGGYRFVDDEGEPLAGHDFLFKPFDPYLLEVNNYIDGSFPIRRTSFWKYADIMKQPDGLWDSNIKSLQDWDFWLSVVKNGGKGVYIQDIFFGTTLPHPGGLSDDSSKNWVDRIDTIKKKHNIPDRRLCVASLGAAWHAQRCAYMLGADFKEMPSFKPHKYDGIYVIGFYPEFAQQQDSMFLQNLYDPKAGRTPAKKIVHFVGTDIWQLYHTSVFNVKNVWVPYLKNGVDHVLVEDDFTKAELKELGIESTVVPIPPAKLFEIRPLPKEFTVACYLPAVNRDFYRPQMMVEVAKKMPDVKFKFFGNMAQTGKDPALPQNIEYCGYVSDMDSFITECTAIMRFPLHDGLPISVLEFLLAGRYSIQSTPVAHTIFTQDIDVDTIVRGVYQLKEISEKNGVNKDASDFWRNRLDHKKYKEAIWNLVEYKPKEYWEDRATSWVKQAASQPIEIEEVKEMFLKAGAKSVLDIGCGDGRWYPHLKEWGIEKYEGRDISENLIKAAQMRFPALKDSFHATKVEDMPSVVDKTDLIFSYTCLEHITEENMPKAVEAMKGRAKKALIIEPVRFTSRSYCHSHDYEKLFNVIEKKQLKDKTIYLCNLE